MSVGAFGFRQPGDRPLDRLPDAEARITPPTEHRLWESLTSDLDSGEVPVYLDFLS